MEYNALLEDGTEDYMKECDIDGKDIKLIDEKSVKKKQNKPSPVTVIKTSSKKEKIPENNSTDLEIIFDQGNASPKLLPSIKKENPDDSNTDLEIVNEVASTKSMPKIEEIEKNKEKTSPRKCHLCFDKFFDTESYQYHIKTLEEDINRLFSCQFCDKVFKKRQCLISHLRIIHDNKAMNTPNVEKVRKTIPEKNVITNQKLSMSKENHYHNKGEKFSGTIYCNFISISHHAREFNQT